MDFQYFKSILALQTLPLKMQGSRPLRESQQSQQSLAQVSLISKAGLRQTGSAFLWTGVHKQHKKDQIKKSVHSRNFIKQVAGWVRRDSGSGSKWRPRNDLVPWDNHWHGGSKSTPQGIPFLPLHQWNLTSGSGADLVRNCTPRQKAFVTRTLL